MLICPFKQRKYSEIKLKMERACLKIRITTDDEMKIRELCDRAIAWAFVQEGSLEEFLPEPVNFHIYLETYLKPQNVRDLIRRKVGNGNENYSMKKVKRLPLDYLAYMIKKEQDFHFRHYNIPLETLKNARLYDENAAKHSKLEGLAKLKVLLPEKPTDLQIRECILKYYHEHDKPFHHENMKAEYDYLRFHYKLAPKNDFLLIFD